VAGIQKKIRDNRTVTGLDNDANQFFVKFSYLSRF